MFIFFTKNNVWWLYTFPHWPVSLDVGFLSLTFAGKDKLESTDPSYVPKGEAYDKLRTYLATGA